MSSQKSKNHSLPRIDQSWFIYCPPTEITHARHVRAVLIELAHALDGEALERCPVPAPVREQVEQRKDGGHARTPDGGEEVVCKGRAAVRSRDGGDGEDFEEARSEMGGEVTAVKAAL